MLILQDCPGNVEFQKSDRFRLTAAVTVILAILAGCVPKVSIIHHEPEVARREADEVLRLLYVVSVSEAAYQRLDPRLQAATSPEELKRLRSSLIRQLGELADLRSDSFSPNPGQRSITLYYIGSHRDGKASYHRVLLSGDAAGYRVAGLWFQDHAYPTGTLRQQFESPTILK